MQEFINNINNIELINLVEKNIISLIPDELLRLNLLKKIFIKKNPLKKLYSNTLITFIIPITFINSNKSPVQDFILNYCTIIELLNIATKIHNNIHSNSTNKEQSILTGDLIFTITFEKMVKLNNIKYLEVFSAATKKMAVYEAKLLEINNESSFTYKYIINLLEQKYLSLFDLIIFLLEKSDNNEKKIIYDKVTLFINNLNKINILNKIINKKFYFNIPASSIIYNKNNLSSIKKMLDIAINEQHLLTLQLGTNFNHDQLLNLIKISSS